LNEIAGAAPRLRLSQYLGYSAGEVANNLTFQMVAVFLLIYYTDVAGISASLAGTLLLVVRIWGGFTDLLAGHLVDETDSSLTLTLYSVAGQSQSAVALPAPSYVSSVASAVSGADMRYTF